MFNSILRMVVVLVIVCVAAMSQVAAGNGTTGHPDKKASQGKQSSKLDTSSLEKDIRESVKEASEKQATHADDHLKNEGELVKYTSQLALATDRLAEFTFRLFVVTGVLSFVSIGQFLMFWRQLGVMRDAAQTAQDEFLSTHRPAIVVHSVEVVHHGNMSDTEATVEALITFFNSGTSDATKIATFGKITAIAGSPVRPGLLLPPIRDPGLAIASGVKGCFWVHSNMTYDETMGHPERIVCIGRIEYADSLGRTRETGFCRELEPRGTDALWQKPKSDDGYEYAY